MRRTQLTHRRTERPVALALPPGISAGPLGGAGCGERQRRVYRRNSTTPGLLGSFADDASPAFSFVPLASLATVRAVMIGTEGRRADLGRLLQRMGEVIPLRRCHMGVIATRGSLSTGSPAPTRPLTRPPSEPVKCAGYAIPLPSKRSISAPGRRRSTRVTWCAIAAGRSIS
ncbi:MAG: hypothetical protein U0841_23840 [Chloroflexia bacterium]